MNVSLVFQIAAQELSDNRVITLSMAGRKLDKKVSGAVSGGCNVKFLPLGSKEISALGVAVTESNPTGENFRVKLCEILWLLGTAVPQFPFCHGISSFITRLRMEGFCVAQDLCISMSQRQQIYFFSGSCLELPPDKTGSFDDP